MDLCSCQGSKDLSGLLNKQKGKQISPGQRLFSFNLMLLCILDSLLQLKKKKKSGSSVISATPASQASFIVPCYATMFYNPII